MLHRLVPKKLASQLLALLFIALIIAFAFALCVTLIIQAKNDRTTRDRLAAERVTELATTLKALAPDKRQMFAKNTGTRTTSIKVELEPAVIFTATNKRSAQLADLIISTSKIGDVRASVLSRNEFTTTGNPRDAGRNREVIAISYPLDKQEWLNYNSREPLTWFTRSDQQFIFFVFGLSMICVLGFAGFFVRRLTHPIEAIAEAAKMAARGDRSARISPHGPAEFQAAADAFNSMQEKIDQFESERMRTVAAVGHDLRTPITSLRVRTELIENEELRQPMINTLAEMTAMADGLVSYARNSREEEFKNDLNLHELLKSIACEYNAPFTSHTYPIITGGPVSLTRAIRNIVDNADRYANDVTITLDCTNKHAIIQVRDSGPGIKQDLIDSVFAPFVRGEDSRNADTGGHGLGLTISKEIIGAHGGDIALENVEGKGLVVSVFLPLREK